MKAIKIIFLTLVVVAISALAVLCFWSDRFGKQVTNFYQNEYLSFEYPNNVELLFESPFASNASSQGIEFLVYDTELATYRSTDLHLSYLVSLGENESETFNSFEDLTKNYGQYGTNIFEYKAGDRTGLRITTGDMTGETFFLVIPSQDNEKEVFRFNGAYMTETVQEILSTFAQTVEFKK